jgi:hypothetical protein
MLAAPNAISSGALWLAAAPGNEIKNALDAVADQPGGGEHD